MNPSSPEHDPNVDAGDDPPSEAGPRPRRRWMWGLLAIGLVAAVIPVTESLPAERQLVLRVKDPSSLERLELLWLDGDEAIQQLTLTFSKERRAAKRINSRVSLRDGDYRLRLTTWRHQRATTNSRKIHLEADASSIIIPVD